MKVNNIHPITREYTGKRDARLDPLETKTAGKKIYFKEGKNFTSKKVPNTLKNEVAIFNDTERSWEVLKDFRGSECFNENGMPAVLNAIGIDAPPIVQENEAACLVNGTWVVKPDFRGTVYWVDYDKYIQNVIGNLPGNAVLQDPGPKPKSEAEKQTDINIAARQSMLEINLASIELLRKFISEKFVDDPLAQSLIEKEREYLDEKTKIIVSV